MHFVAAPDPCIQIEAEYHLKNSGTQAIRELELRLPGRRRFHFEEPRVTWDTTALTTPTSKENTRNSLISLPDAWKVSARHTLWLSVEYLPATAGETGPSFSEDAFYGSNPQGNLSSYA